VAAVPALGFAAYNPSSDPDKNSSTTAFPSLAPVAAGNATLSNGRATATFSPATYLLGSVTTDGVSVGFVRTFWQYMPVTPPASTTE